MSKRNIEQEKAIFEQAKKVEAERELLKACVTGDFDIVKKAIESNVNINVQDSFGCYPLYNAISWRKKDIIKYLLDHGANPNIGNGTDKVALASVGRDGDVEVLKWLLDAGAKIDAMEKKTGFTALTAAALLGTTEAVAFLLDQGANPDKYKKGQATAIHEAILMGRVDVVKLLIKAKANPYVVNYADKTPLEFAREKGNKEIIEICQRWHVDYPMQKFKENRDEVLKTSDKTRPKPLNLKRRKRNGVRHD